MKRVGAMFCLAVLLCSAFGSGVAAAATERGSGGTADSAAAARGEKVVKISGDDWGYPTPFAHYPRGPGYVRMSFMFDTLTWKDERGEIPWLADSWSRSYDAKEWTFYLHRGVKWSDGEPFTADDVKFTFDYMKEHPQKLSYDEQNVDSVDILDPYTVRINLKESRPAFINDVAGSIPIIPEHIWKDVDDPSKYRDEEAVIGTGPLRLEDYVSEQDYYEYEANTKCFKGQPIIDRFISRKVGDDAFTLTAGDIDAASFWGKEKVAMEEFIGDPDFEIIQGPSWWVRKLYFNCEKYPTNNKKFRHALAYGIDREGFVKNILHDGAIVANTGIIHPESKWYKDGLEGYDYNATEANRILEEELNFTDTDGNGVRNYPAAEGGEDIEFVLYANTIMDGQDEAEFIQENLAEIGIKTVVKMKTSKELDPILKSGDFSIAISGHGAIVQPRTLYTLYTFYSYQNETYDDLYKQQLKTMDEDYRMELVGQMQEIIADELPVYALYHPKMWEVYNPEKLNTWFYTKDGIAFGIPLAQNKLIFLFDAWRYDENGNGIIEKSEVIDAIEDYFDEKITKKQVKKVIKLYFL